MAERGLFARGLATAWACLVDCGASLFAGLAAHAHASEPRLRAAVLATFFLVALLWMAGPTSGLTTLTGTYRLVLMSLATLATAALSLVVCLRGRARLGRTALLVLAGAAAVAIGRSVHAAQLAGVLPAHAFTRETVAFPLANGTLEVVCSQLVFLLFGVAAASRPSRHR